MLIIRVFSYDNFQTKGATASAYVAYAYACALVRTSLYPSTKACVTTKRTARGLGTDKKNVLDFAAHKSKEKIKRKLAMKPGVPWNQLQSTKTLLDCVSGQGSTQG